MKTTDPDIQPFVVSLMSQKNENTINSQAEQRVEIRSGDQCPACQSDYMDYDGMLNLTCPSCGYTQGGCFT
jgi:Zn finger protein HypA/HybF involved in hydrogenase expression